MFCLDCFCYCFWCLCWFEWVVAFAGVVVWLFASAGVVGCVEVVVLWFD